MKAWIGLVVILVLAACQAQPVPVNTPLIALTEEGTAEPFVVPDCLPAAGVTLKLQKISNAVAEVIATGLQPGEFPYLWYGIPGSRWSGGDMNATGANGEFFYQLDDLETPSGQTSATWDVRLVHARGVACARLTLP